ncbi:hypothetical protein ACF1CG_37315 [Streptomyces sp. NPDC014773]|uniref:hypothetical protein n=1 Tax=Streptomyces sp. NPDC014773 TaxID=3364908 RepID=UPI0036F88532
MGTAPHRRPLGLGPDVPDRLPHDRWARTAAGEWTAAPGTTPPPPRTGRRPLGDGPADPGAAPGRPG